MSQKDVERLRKLYEAANRGDVDAYFDGVSPEIEFHLSGAFPDLEPVYRGHAGVRRFFEQFTEPWEELSVEPDRFVDRGSRIVALVHFHARGRDGIEVQLPLAHLWTIEDGQAVRMDADADQDEALKAMSPENVESLRAFLETWDIRASLEAWNRGEDDLTLFDAEVTYEDTTLPDHIGETYRGLEGVARATERWIEPYEALTIALEQIVGAGDRFVSIHRVRAKARHTGIEFEGPVAYLWTFRDGRVVHFRSYRDPQEALEAGGLRGS